MESIIIIGGGTMQLPVIKQAQKMDLEVWAVDGNPDCAGFKYLHQEQMQKAERNYTTIIADISDEDLVFKKVKEAFKNKHLNPNGVLTVGTDYSRTVSKIGEYYHLSTLPYSLSQFLTNKYLMRKKLTEAGLPQPKYKRITSSEDFIAALEYFATFTDLVVIKPVDSMGARGVKLLELSKSEVSGIDNKRFIADYENALYFSKVKEVIMEEKISGKEYSLDALAFEDDSGLNIQITGVADRIIEYSPYFIETGHVIPSQQPEAVVKLLEEGFKAAINAISRTASEDDSAKSRHVCGAFKGDVFFSEAGEVVVGEIAGRLSGGYMSGYTYPLSSGVNLMEAAINIALGKNPLPVMEQKLGVVVEKALINTPGCIIKIEGAEKAKSSPGVKELFIRVKEGDTIQVPQNNLMKSANVITRGKNYLEANNFATQALAELKVVTG